MLTPPERQAIRVTPHPAELHSEPLARLAEANHRIANNLSLIIGLIRAEADSYAARRAPVAPEEVYALLESIAGRIEAVGQLHRLLSTDPERSTVDLGDYLARLCAAVVAFTDAGAGVALDAALSPGCRLRPDQVLPLALIVSEAVTNAVKYAHPAGAPGRIGVSCGREPDGRLLVEVADDGVGLPDAFDPEHDGGLGLRVIRGLARQLGAELRLESAGLGLSIQVRLPATLYAAS